MPKIDYSAILSALFLPLLFWTGSVLTITLMGYPGIVCMTPVAWLLALPVGLRMYRESSSPGTRPVLEAALAGGLLGFWQGMLVPAVMAVSRYLPGQEGLSDPPDPIFAALLMTLVSIPAAAGLAALITWLARRRASQQ